MFKNSKVEHQYFEDIKTTWHIFYQNEHFCEWSPIGFLNNYVTQRNHDIFSKEQTISKFTIFAFNDIRTGRHISTVVST